MTRQRVDPDKRQRTAHACESCKRRKQKCDGRQPCAACSRRRFECHYSSNDPQHRSPTPNDILNTTSDFNSPISTTQSRSDSSTSLHSFLSTGVSPTNDFNDLLPRSPLEDANALFEPGSGFQEGDTDAPSFVQMVKDPQGRMQYIGNSASPFFLKLVRMLARTLTGDSKFTKDGENQQHMTDRNFMASSNVNIRNLLPTKDVALTLVESFFTNTTGTLEIFSEQAFIKSVHHNYRSLNNVEPIWLCHFYLVIAIGLSLATPLAGTKEASVIAALNTNHPHRCEEYYFAAKKMCHPQDGFEDADFWSIQALALMSWFMLCRSQRSRAYAYAGMAIRSAYALGLHKQDSLMHFEALEQDDRRKTWRTLFMLDLFLADSLGRPPSIADPELSGPILNPSTLPRSLINGPGIAHVCTAAFEASLMSAHTISQILRKVYMSPKLEIGTIQEIAVVCREWPHKRASFLSWRAASPKDVRKSTAILHCNLSYCHTIILLSRPLFLQLLKQEVERKHAHPEHRPVASHKIVSKYATICVEACAQTISIIHTAFMGGYLPRLNPLAGYHVFSAAIVIFFNELVRPGTHAQSHRWMEASMAILKYCAVEDPQARDSVQTLEDLKDLITAYRRQEQQQQQRPLPSLVMDHFQPTPPPDRQHPTGVFGQDFVHPHSSASPHFFPESSATPPFSMGSYALPSPFPEHPSERFPHHDFPGLSASQYLTPTTAEPYPSFPRHVDSMPISGPAGMAPNLEVDENWEWNAANALPGNTYQNLASCR